ncbi:MAG: molybdopterin-dependent oxidoreductase [Thermomicrobiales bacterium]
MSSLCHSVSRLRLGVMVWFLVLAGAVALPLPAVVAQSTPVAAPGAAGAIDVTGLVERAGKLTVADLQTLPGETVDVTYESGGKPEDHTFTGVRLVDVLDYLGLAVAPEARNPLLPMYLVVTANDGYQVVVSGGEIDPNFGNVPMLLAWEQDGVPLAGAQGPLRLVVPGDLRGGRYVHGIVSIEVRTVAGD